MNNSDQSLQLAATLMLHCSEGAEFLLFCLDYFTSQAGKNPIYSPRPPSGTTPRLPALAEKRLDKSMGQRQCLFHPPWGLRQFGLSDFSQLRALDRTLITRTTVWDCVTRRRDPRLAVNSGQARLSPLGFPARL